MTKSYWKAWQEFEVRYGNEDTFREMLRIKRSVQAQYNTQVNLMSAQMLTTASKEVEITGQWLANCQYHVQRVLISCCTLLRPPQTKGTLPSRQLCLSLTLAYTVCGGRGGGGVLSWSGRRRLWGANV